jgi:SnoaL-like polyketide cyclase
VGRPRMVGRGTWRGELDGQPANGRVFTLRGSGFFHGVQGKIRFQRGYWDKATWFGQLGLPISSEYAWDGAYLARCEPRRWANDDDLDSPYIVEPTREVTP